MLLGKINSPRDLKHLKIFQLPGLCQEVANVYLKSMSQIGGHLGASLGVVELTVALHYVFDAPKDKIIWDVGHQAHIHKMLTGRCDKISTIKQEGGISGFAKRSESVYDAFGAGHSSTSISAGVGMGVASKLQNKNNKVVAVIGDGAIGAGLAYEAMNNAQAAGSNLMVILNDNQMSISPTVGAMSKYLASISSKRDHLSFREIIKNFTNKFPINIFFKKALKALEGNLQKYANQSNIFENLGFDYLGPIDGHDIDTLVKVLHKVKNRSESSGKPLLLHVVTKKGNGVYLSNGGEEESFHSVNKFCVDTGIQEKTSSHKSTYTKVFANSLIREATKDERIVAITAAMPSGTGLHAFQKNFSSRFFDVGIAEQHAVTFAAGLACDGINPFVVIYSTFLQRAYDQVIHDVAIQNLPVKFAIDRAGVVGGDGATHNGSFDLAYLSSLPNFVVMAPSDENELSKMIATAAAYNDGPIAFRYPRGEVVGVKADQAEEIITIGKGRILYEGDGKVAILSIGTRLQEALKARDILQDRYGISTTVADARFAKPLDEALVEKLSTENDLLITIEEGSVGGLSTYVNNFILQKDLSQHVRVRNLFLPDVFLNHGKVVDLHASANIDSNAIIEMVSRELNLSNIRTLKSIKFKCG